MAFSNQNRRRPQTVPVELARQLVDERDQLARRAQKEQRENDRLRARVEQAADRLSHERDLAEAAADEAEMLRKKLAEVRRERDGLRERLESGQGEVAAQAEADESEPEIVDALHRRVADLTNDIDRLHRRTEKEIDDARRSERGRLLSGLGDILDSVERALASGEVEGPWKAGLEAIRSQLVTFIEAEGARLTGVVGEVMDPRLHEVVGARQAAGAARGEIVDVVRRGIELENDSIARTAQVIVAA